MRWGSCSGLQGSFNLAPHIGVTIRRTSEICIWSQGTLYPDVIESCPPPGGKQKHSHMIKSHHNVGGLPKDLQFTLIEPLRELFKVRQTLNHVPDFDAPPCTRPE